VGKTITGKILSSHSGKKVCESDIALAGVYLLMGHDWNAPLTIQVMKNMGAEKVFDPRKILLVMDHGVPSPNEKIGAMQAKTEAFARSQGIRFCPPGEGICHQLLPQEGHVRHGMVVVGSDSHTTTYGALNALSMGVGSTDLAAALASGKLWFKVPSTVKGERSLWRMEGAIPASLASPGGSQSRRSVQQKWKRSSFSILRRSSGRRRVSSSGK